MTKKVQNKKVILSSKPGIEQNTPVPESEFRHAFLLRLSDALRTIQNPVEILETASRMVGEQLGVDRAAYGELEDDRKHMNVERDWTAPNVSSIAGRYYIPDFGDFFTGRLHKGETAIVEDTLTDPRVPEGLYESTWQFIGVRSSIACPVFKNGRFIAAFFVHVKEPRKWSDAEIALVEKVTDRTWEAMERARSVEALRESEDRFRWFVAASSDLIYCMSADWTKMYVLSSDSFLKNTEQANSDWMLHYIPDEDRKLVWTTISEAIRQKKIFDLEHRVIQANGQIGWVHSKALPVFDKDGTIIEWRGAAADITRRKIAEQQLLNYNERLEQEVSKRTRELQDLEAGQHREVARVSMTTLEEERYRISESLHNGLGQLLYGVKISLAHLTPELSADRDSFQKNKQYTDQLLTQAIRESRRISHELMPAMLEDFGLQAAIEDICKQFSNDIRFNCFFKGFTGRLDKYLESAIFRIVQELMTNVIKHARATIASTELILEKGIVHIRVKDNGIGIKNAGQEHAGIGLKSIRSKVSLFNGQVRISSGAKKGTLVEVDLPVSLQTNLPV